MKRLILLFSLFTFHLSLFGQTPEPIVIPTTGAIVGGAGFIKIAGDPNKINSIRVINEKQYGSFAWDTVTLRLWQYDRQLSVGKRWKLTPIIEYSNGTPTTGSRDTAYKFVVDTFNRVGYICNASGCVSIGGTSVTASSGLTLASGDIKLGGTLSQTAIIVTDATNRLQIRGLQSTAAGDSVVMVDPLTGTLKRKNAFDFGAAISANSIDSVYLKAGGVSASDAGQSLIDTIPKLIIATDTLNDLRIAADGKVATKGITVKATGSINCLSTGIWTPNNDSQHKTYGITDVVQNTYTIEVKFATVPHSVGAVAQVDDALAAHNITTGLSSGLSSVVIRLYCNQGVDGKVSSNGSAVSISGVQGTYNREAGDVTVAWDASNAAMPVIRVSHPAAVYTSVLNNIYVQPDYATGTTNLLRPIVVASTTSSFDVAFVDAAGAIVTTQSSFMKFSFVRNGQWQFPVERAKHLAGNAIWLTFTHQ